MPHMQSTICIWGPIMQSELWAGIAYTQIKVYTLFLPKRLKCRLSLNSIGSHPETSAQEIQSLFIRGAHIRLLMLVFSQS